jgi:hypothetical protein
MNHPLIEEAVLLVLNNGGIVDLILNKEYGYIEYNLNTGMKSGLSLYEKDNKVWAITRYNDDERMTDINSILDTARDCLFGRDYAAYAWINILREYGYHIGDVRGN